MLEDYFCCLNCIDRPGDMADSTRVRFVLDMDPHAPLWACLHGGRGLVAMPLFIPSTWNQGFTTASARRPDQPQRFFDPFVG